MSKIERRYARLIRLYPAAHRAARGQEMLDALLQAPPSARETRALLLGALRAHAARDRPVVARHDWLTAFRAAALMLLVGGVVDRVVYVYEPYLSSAERAGVLSTLALSVVALMCALRGRYLLSAAAALLAMLAAGLWPMHGLALGSMWGYPLVILLLIPLRWFRPGPASGVLKYLPLLPVLLTVGDWVYAEAFPAVSGILERGALMGVAVVALLWLAVDERVSMAVGLFFLSTLLLQVAYMSSDWVGLSAVLLTLVVTGGPPTVLLAAAAARNRYHATP